jgi:DNA-binding NarL/FixJ family response regulator
MILQWEGEDMRRVEQLKIPTQRDETKQREAQVIALTRQGLGNEAIAQAVGRTARYVQKTKLLLRDEGRL